MPSRAPLLLLASLFVLGGNFWDKLRSLFDRTAKVDFGRIAMADSRRAARWKAALVIFALGVLGLVWLPLAETWRLPPEWKSMFHAWAKVGPILAFVTSAILAGKSGVERVLSRFKETLPAVVSRPQYIIGLIMFVTPILAAFLMPYFFHALPHYAENRMLYGLANDLVLMASLFVLGGNFWDKLRSLYVSGATVRHD